MKCQIIDINYRSEEDRTPVMNIFGVTESGKPSVVEVFNFKPFFYVLPVEGRFDYVFSEVGALDREISLEIVERFKPIGYQSTPTRMIKVFTVSPKDVKPLRERVKQISGVLEVFEADILFHSRFSADTDIKAMDWIEFPEDKEELECGDIVKLDIKEDAPFKMLSVDIECLPGETGFPSAENDPIILISLSFSSVYRNTRDMVIIARGMECPRDDVIAVKDEKELLTTFRSIVLDYNPDFVTGYNINEFDAPYISTRMDKNGISGNFGRDGSKWYIKQIGNKKEIMVAGRVVVDTLPMVRRNYSLNQYTLKNVAKELLNLEKLDVPPSKMREYWLDNSDKFVEFIKYSRRDAVLGLMLLTDLGMLQKYIALAKVSGILLQTVISGGQSVMLEFMLLQRFNRVNRVMAMKPSGDEEESEDVEFQGAYVSEPEIGLYEHLILTDMQSLYPSIIISNNLCPTTVVIDEDVPDGKSHVDPNGGKFVNSDVLPGILPKMLDEVLKKRLEVKKVMKASSGHEKDILDAVQYALKIVINSAYGWCGYKRSRLFNLTVASAVTAYGRETIVKVRRDIEGIKDLEVNGNLFNFKVLYTDTDSAYVNVISSSGDIKLDDIDIVGKKVAEIVSKPMVYPMKLNYEGYARRVLFLAKKRYAMWLMEKGKDGQVKDKIKVKGIEMVRRDWCKLTAKCMKDILDLILKEGKIEDAAKLANRTINRVRAFKMDDKELLDGLALTRNYHKGSESYKNLPAHMRLVNRMERRGEQLPGIGDRIEYYIVRGNEKFCERAETLDHILNGEKTIDTGYYVSKQLIPPLKRIFDALGIDMMTGRKMKHQGNIFSFEGKRNVYIEDRHIREETKLKVEKRKSNNIFSFGK